ncbi:RNA polymerase sigma factor SigZ [Rhodopirellula bahusiensis]|uniref:RNA polymerase sigma factor SigZ n=1 Tax=Rhodopirellula bahusiensis TaxID=2014065 RepID=A0A2G1VYR4_9BACT|nr:RNA polymerase sigma factor SigZ [Rhodopirellula bahusiensis]PHQ31885.1 RNA polymerase sigma factor SigZ [Rhodopirellula bahusiensis]
MSHDNTTTAQLWSLFGEQLRSFFMHRVSDAQLAEDLLQETFVRIHTKLDGVDDQQRIRSWVFQIARNLVVDHYRVKSREAATLADEVNASPESEESVEEVVIGWLPKMLEQLPSEYQEAIELYELKGMSQQEIADKLGISLSGAKSRVQRGRTKLKQVLFDCCSFEHDRRGNLISYQRNHADDPRDFDA